MENHSARKSSPLLLLLLFISHALLVQAFPLAPFASPIQGGKGPSEQDVSNQGLLPQSNVPQQQQQQDQEELAPLSAPKQQQQQQQQDQEDLAPLSAPQQQQPEELAPLSAPQQQQQQQDLAPLSAPQQQQQQDLAPLSAPQQQQQQDQRQLSPLSFSQQLLPQQNPNQPFSSLNNRPFGVTNHQQPLVDNTPFDSGSSKVEMGLVCLVGLVGYFGLHLL